MDKITVITNDTIVSVMGNKAKIDLTQCEKLSPRTVFDPEDFSVNLVLCNKFAIKMTCEQLDELKRIL